MSDLLILYVAVGVFSLMLIGLWLTVREFRTNIIVTSSAKPNGDTPRENRESPATPGRVTVGPSKSVA